MKTAGAILGATLGFAFATWLGWVVVAAFRSGVACIAGGKAFKRQKSPLGFWGTVLIQAAFTVMFLSIAVGRLSEIAQ